MTRTIYEVYAKVVDANGSYNTLTEYPKTFDSRSYGGDTEKTLQRAKGEFHDTFGDMCKRDDRQLQTVILMTAAGQIIDRQTIGKIADDPDPDSADVLLKATKNTVEMLKNSVTVVDE